MRVSCHIVSWRVSDANTNDPSVEIVGRGAGLSAFLLRLVGVSPTMHFSLEGGTIRMLSHSWSGREECVVPTNKIRSSRFGFVKPWGQALAIFIGAVESGRAISAALGVGSGSFHRFVAQGGLLVPAAVFGVVAAFFHYTYQRKLVFSVTAKSGERFDFSFYPSVIEGVTIDERQGLRVLQALQSATNPNYIVMEQTAA